MDPGRRQGVSLLAHPIALARLDTIQRQQFRQMLFKHQLKFLVARRRRPFALQALAQAPVVDLPDQIVNGGRAGFPC